MRRYDTAIHGFGMLPGLLAVHLAGRDPARSILLLSGDATCCGEALELVPLASLSPAAAALIEPFVVTRWPGYLTIRGGLTEQCAGEVLLLDPVQVWLELQDLLAEDGMPARCSEVVLTGDQLNWSGGSAQVGQLIDLSPLTLPDEHSEIVGIELVRSLALPVLADYDADAPWDAYQHVPLGDERVYIRKRRFRGGIEDELVSGFGWLLSELIAA